MFFWFPLIQGKSVKWHNLRNPFREVELMKMKNRTLNMEMFNLNFLMHRFLNPGATEEEVADLPF